jgi:hypothetical protein
MKRIEIIVDPQGNTRLETRGFAGAACREASKFLEEALGSRTGETLTAEFHKTDSIGQHRQQHGG